MSLAILTDDAYDVIEEFGETVDILRLASKGAENVYRQSGRTFDAPFSLKCHAARDATPDELMAMGLDQTARFAVVFDRRHVAEQAPAFTLVDVVRSEDQVIIDSETFRITETKITARIEGVPILLLVGLTDIKN